MKAAIYTRYGPPEVVRIADVEQPRHKADEVLVKVHATTVNRTDTGFRSAEYFVSRFWSGLFRPKYPILGCEFAGVVEAVGEQVSNFKIGDRVFGYNDETFGGHAAYICASANAIAIIPEGMSFEKAAPLTEGSHYALTNIRASRIQSGQNALVYGATGAIGSAAVQLLKHLGVKVTAVCNTKNIALVKSLGAEVVIDYQTQDFTQIQTRFELIFDAVGKSSFLQCRPLLQNKGLYVSTELGTYGANIFFALTTPLFGGKKVLFPIPTMRQEDILFLKDLAEKKAFLPVIDSIYPFDAIVAAHQYVASGQKTGNVLIKMDEC